MLKLKAVRKFSVALFALATTTGAGAQAVTMSGQIRNDGGAAPIYLVLSNPASGPTSLVVDAHSPVLEFLRRLRTGDQITAQCTFSSDGRRVTIDSVDRVGLQELLGTWRSSRWEIFEFRDFTSLNLYVPTVVDAGAASLVRTHALKYVITPEQEDRYSIFMSDDLSVRMGFLEITATRLSLTITDPKTGQIGENISLSPLHLQ